ncbi:MAG: hypothetical protein K5756_09255 [Clostridiales bacterium]|nr:hypothetical protein [Clostridiales bacterium]
MNKVKMTVQSCGAGVCDKCGREHDKLYTVNLSDGDSVLSDVMCMGCTMRLKTDIDKFSPEELRQFFPVRQPQPAYAAEQSSNVSVQPEPEPQPIPEPEPTADEIPVQVRPEPKKKPWLAIVIAVILLAAVVLGAIFLPGLFRSNEPTSTADPVTAGNNIAADINFSAGSYYSIDI